MQFLYIQLPAETRSSSFLCSGACTFAAWHALNLVNNISNSETHFLAITLRRNLASTNVRSSYKFEDMAVEVMQEKFADKASVSTPGMLSMPMDPMQMVALNRAACIKHGGFDFGGMLVAPVELTNGERKSPEQAVQEVCALL